VIACAIHEHFAYECTELRGGSRCGTIDTAKVIHRAPINPRRDRSIGRRIAGSQVAKASCDSYQENHMASTSVAFDDDVYEISAAEVSEDIPSQWQSAATYTLELPVRCPHCDEKLRTIRVVGLTRSQVSFTSTLPRKGRVAVCPECDRILPVELAGMM
jgi:hypothetical protein